MALNARLTASGMLKMICLSARKPRTRVSGYFFFPIIREILLMSSPFIYVKDLVKTYTRISRAPGLWNAATAIFRPEKTTIAALKGISLSISQGEFVAYLGPNGSGKSTTIKILCGILTPTSGVCKVGEHTPWLNRIAHTRSIGVVFGQRSQLWWDLPVADSYELLKSIYKIPSNEYRARLNYLIDKLDLGAFMRVQTRVLSLGQRMKCELVGSLLHNPALLILDEPTIGLDISAKKATYEVIKEWNQKYGTTILLTTHDLSDVENLCERTILIAHGKIEFDGSMHDLRSRIGKVRRLSMDIEGSTEIALMDGVQILKRKDSRIELEVDTSVADLQSVVSFFCHHFTINDFSIHYPPLEDAILPYCGGQSRDAL